MTPHDQHTSMEELTAAELDRLEAALRPGHLTALSIPRRTAFALISAARRTVERQGEGLEAALAGLVAWASVTDAEVPRSEAATLDRLLRNARRELAAARHPTPDSADGAENGREG